MAHSVDSVGTFRDVLAHNDPSREAQTFRGVMIAVALGAMLWAPLGVVALRLF